jgi:hypothetical protein
MAQTSTQRAAPRTASPSRNGRSPNRSSNASSRRTARRSAAAVKSVSSRGTARKRSASRARAGRSGTSSRAAVNRSRRSRSPRSSSNGIAGALGSVGKSVGSATQKAGSGVGTAVRKGGAPALVGTAAGIAGGLALGSRISPGRTAKRVPMPKIRAGALKSVANNAQQVGKDIAKAGFRLGVGDVNMEVQSGKRKENRDSPLEVLLKGLTSRRSNR